MYRLSVEDLQYQIHDLKKQLLEVREDNHLYKVKIRKLQDEVRKRDKQLEVVLDPKKASNMKKMFSQHGASLVMNLREENNYLQKELIDKNQTIKRLQWQINTMKLYYNDHGSSSSNQKISGIADEEVNECNSTRIRKKRSKSVSSRRISSRPNSPRHPSQTYSDLVEDNYITMLNTNLEIIKNNGSFKDIQTNRTHTNLSLKSPTTSVPNSLTRDTPHQEIQQLQGCLLTVLSEVDSLKDTIVDLQEAQQKTHSVLEQKNCNIEKLASEIENLKQHQKTSPTASKQPHKLRDCKDADATLSTILEKSLYDYTISENRDGFSDEDEKKSLKDITVLKPATCLSFTPTEQSLVMESKSFN